MLGELFSINNYTYRSIKEAEEKIIKNIESCPYSLRYHPPKKFPKKLPSVLKPKNKGSKLVCCFLDVIFNLLVSFTNINSQVIFSNNPHKLKII